LSVGREETLLTADQPANWRLPEHTIRGRWYGRTDEKNGGLEGWTGSGVCSFVERRNREPAAGRDGAWSSTIAVVSAGQSLRFCCTEMLMPAFTVSFGG